jgi:hypothetical protein
VTCHVTSPFALIPPQRFKSKKVCKDGWMGGWLDEWMDGWNDERMEGLGELVSVPYI